ncbi:importin subunit beta-1 [Tanacetum coccineum]
MERDYIMKVVCESTLSPEVKMRQAAFECLVSISSSYYEKIAPYMQNIFNVTAKVVKEDEEPVALQSIKFWSSICDEEIDILEDYGEDQDQDKGAWNIAMLVARVLVWLQEQLEMILFLS